MKFNKDKYVYLIVNFITLVCLMRQIKIGNSLGIIQGIIALALYLVPFLMSKILKIKLCKRLEIVIYIFIFCALVLGEVLSFYKYVKYYDKVIHTFNGVLMTSVGMVILNSMNKRNNNKYMLVLFGFSFSMMTAGVWEIFEFNVDKYLKQDMQTDTIINKISSDLLEEKEVEISSFTINKQDYYKKYGGYIDIGLIDTMGDMTVNLIGTIIYSIYTLIKLRKISQ